MAKRTEQQVTIDEALTKELNRHDAINDHMASCAARLYGRFRNNPNVLFYVKGSAALGRYLRKWRISEATVNEICARSDWDTQLVINPWLSRAAWFREFKECQAVIRECLDQFEEELLAVFAQIFPPTRAVSPEVLAGKTNDQALRSQQNALAKGLRDAIGDYFGRLFLATSEAKKYHIDTDPEKYWNLSWNNIFELGRSGRTKDILEMDIQAHNQATLTSAIIHPGQALNNLNSVMSHDELRLLTATTQAAAAATWQRMSVACDAYDEMRANFIQRSPLILGFVKKKLLDLQSEVVLINHLPEHIIGATIAALPEVDRVRLAGLWRQLQDAKALMDIDADATPQAPVDFYGTLIASLKANPGVAGKLVDWCMANLNLEPGLLTSIADMHHQNINEMLPAEQRELLNQVERTIDAQYDRYHDQPEPEDVAEAEKKDTESLAPFALVSKEKGSRKVGSILENMTIRDFYLYRLMIRCQLSNKDPDHRLIPDAPDGMDFDTFKQRFKFRAELLDISVPRDDSLETAEQWVHTSGHIKAGADGIPLPDGYYFIDEYVFMLREALDKKSSSLHKLTMRLRRACMIAEAFANELRETGRLDERSKALAERYPAFASTMQGRDVAPANAIVFMRMCEQLLESYDLVRNEKLQADSALMIKMSAKDLHRILTTELTHETFYELMQIYTRLGNMIYNQAFVLAGLRRKRISDDLLMDTAQNVMQEIAAAFGNDQKRFRCAVVEDFAIMAEPDLPEPLKETLPLDVLKIIVYTTIADAKYMWERLQSLVPQIRSHFDEIRGMAGRVDVGAENGVVYARLNHQVGDDLPDWALQGSPGKAVFLRIEVVVDDNVENWVAPAHKHDLRAIVKQYRRSLPRHTEYAALSKKKNILQQMETALTTY